MKTSGKAPSPRGYHIMQTLGSCCYVIGGRGVDQNVVPEAQFVACFDAQHQRWLKIDSIEGESKPVLVSSLRWVAKAKYEFFPASFAILHACAAVHRRPRCACCLVEECHVGVSLLTIACCCLVELAQRKRSATMICGSFPSLRRPACGGQSWTRSAKSGPLVSVGK